MANTRQCIVPITSSSNSEHAVIARLESREWRSRLHYVPVLNWEHLVSSNLVPHYSASSTSSSGVPNSPLPPAPRIQPCIRDEPNNRVGEPGCGSFDAHLLSWKSGRITGPLRNDRPVWDLGTPKVIHQEKGSFGGLGGGRFKLFYLPTSVCGINNACSVSPLTASRCLRPGSGGMDR